MSLPAPNSPDASRPAAAAAGQVLVVASPHARPDATEAARRLGYDPRGADDPYAALIELLERPTTYRAVVLSLQSLYREELAVIRTLRERLPRVQVWLTHTDGRHAAMAEALRLGAAGLLSDEGLHRLGDDDSPASDAVPHDEPVAVPAPLPTDADDAPPPPRRFLAEATPAEGSADAHDPPPEEDEQPDSEPLLTADELRALLQDPGQVAEDRE